MNKEKLLELSDTLRGIAEGKEWECRAHSMEAWSNAYYDPMDALAYEYEIRLKPQPPPQDPYAELKAAHAAGKTIQYNCASKGSSPEWEDVRNPSYDDAASEYRIKPEPRKVPLGSDDVMPCSVFRVKRSGERHAHVINFESVSNDGVDMRGFTTRWAILAQDYEINRSIPLTGKWDKDAWEPCCKEVSE